MSKRKLLEDVLFVSHKKARINGLYNPINLGKPAFEAFAPAFKAYAPLFTLSSILRQLVPDPFQKRKRLEEYDVASSIQEAKRIKPSHVGSNWLRHAPSLSPTSRYRILSNQILSKFENKNDNPTTLIKKAAKSAVADTVTTTTDAALPIRLATPQRHRPASINPLGRGRNKANKKQTNKKKTTTQQQVQGKDKKQQTHKKGRQKQGNSKVPTQIRGLPDPKYSRILEEWYAVDLDHLEQVIR
ncbi:hypothetical protein HDV63DRAFT_142746 [Trichoderma sp. SZMC 28014]